MYAKASKNGRELLSASDTHSNSTLWNVRQGGGRTWLCLRPGLSLCVGQLKKLWELKLLWPHGSFGMKIDLSYLIFTRILGSNNMGGEKMCITWLCRRIIKASSTKILNQFFPAAKAGLVHLLKRNKLLQHIVKMDSICSPRKCYQIEAHDELYNSVFDRKVFL